MERELSPDTVNVLTETEVFELLSCTTSLYWELPAPFFCKWAIRANFESTRSSYLCDIREAFLSTRRLFFFWECISGSNEWERRGFLSSQSEELKWLNNVCISFFQLLKQELMYLVCASLALNVMSVGCKSRNSEVRSFCAFCFSIKEDTFVWLHWPDLCKPLQQWLEQMLYKC